MAACSTSGSSNYGADNSVLQFAAPTITDQEFEDGLPAPGLEYSKEISYEAQLKQDGGTYVKPKTPVRKKSTAVSKTTAAKK